MIDENDSQIMRIVEKKVAEIMNNPAMALEIYRRRTDELEKQNKELKPKADFYDAVTKCDTEFLMRDVAKVLNFKGMGQNKLFEFLRQKRVLNGDNMPYQSPHVDAGRFSYKINKWVNPVTGETITTKTPVITQKGVDYIRKLLLESGYEYNER